MCSRDVRIQAHECSLPSLVWYWKGMSHTCLKLKMYGSKELIDFQPLIWRNHRADSLVSTDSSVKRLNLLLADLIILAPPCPITSRPQWECDHNQIMDWTGATIIRSGKKKIKHWITVAIEIRKWDKGASMLCHAQDSLLQRPSDGQSLPREEYFLNDASEEDCRWQSKHVGYLKNRSYSLF